MHFPPKHSVFWMQNTIYDDIFDLPKPIFSGQVLFIKHINFVFYLINIGSCILFLHHLNFSPSCLDLPLPLDPQVLSGFQWVALKVALKAWLGSPTDLKVIDQKSRVGNLTIQSHILFSFTAQYCIPCIVCHLGSCGRERESQSWGGKVVKHANMLLVIFSKPSSTSYSLQLICLCEEATENVST